MTMTATLTLNTEFMPHYWSWTKPAMLTPENDKPAVDAGGRPLLFRKIWDETVVWSMLVLPVRKDEGSYQITEVTPGGFIPQTSFGRELLSLRTRAIASGMTLLSDDEILEEVKNRRSGLGADETHLY